MLLNVQHFMESELTTCLFDSNILVYANNMDSPFHEPSKKLVEEVLNCRFKGVIAHQNLLELYAVALTSDALKSH